MRPPHLPRLAVLLALLLLLLHLSPAQPAQRLLGGAAASTHASHRSLVTPPKSLAAFYQAHSQPAAVNTSLAFFRLSYPDADVLMVNDGGLKSLQVIAEHYGVQYMYADKVDDATSRSAHHKPLIFTSALAAVTWLTHLFQSLGEAQWLLNLEDDVLVVQPIDLDSLQYDLSGGPPRSSLPEHVQAAVRKLGGSTQEWRYNGCGGSVLRGAFFRRVALSTPWLEQVREIFAGMPAGQSLGADQVLSALVYANGGSLGAFPGFAEKWHRDVAQRVEAGEVSVLHQAKFLYRSPFSFEALAGQAPLGA